MGRCEWRGAKEVMLMLGRFLTRCRKRADIRGVCDLCRVYDTGGSVRGMLMMYTNSCI